jgi:hypothetical protein
VAWRSETVVERRFASGNRTAAKQRSVRSLDLAGIPAATGTAAAAESSRDATLYNPSMILLQEHRIRTAFQYNLKIVVAFLQIGAGVSSLVQIP